MGFFAGPRWGLVGLHIHYQPVFVTDSLVSFEINDGDTSAVAFSTQDWLGCSESLVLVYEFGVVFL